MGRKAGGAGYLGLVLVIIFIVLLKMYKKIRHIFALLCFLSVAIVASAEMFSFRADRMLGNIRATILEGNAELRADNIMLKAPRIELGEDNQFIYSIGRVWVMDEEKNMVFWADMVRYDRIQKIVRLEGNVTLEDMVNGLVAEASYIEYDEDAEVLVMQVSVRLFTDDMDCSAEFAVYRRNDQILDLRGSPVVFKGDDEFRANHIRVDFENDDVIMTSVQPGRIRN